MRPILVFVAALALLLGAVWLGASVVDERAAAPPSSRESRPAARAEKTTSPAVEPDAMAPIGSSSFVKGRIGELKGGCLSVYRERLLEGRSVVSELCRLESESATKRPENAFDLVRPIVTFFDERDKSVVLRLEAAVGSAFVSNRDDRGGITVQLDGDVVGRAYPGEEIILTTDRLGLTIDPGSESRVESISTDASVHVFKEGFDVSGTGLVVDRAAKTGTAAELPDASLDHYEITRNVRVMVSGREALPLGEDAGGEAPLIILASKLVATRVPEEPGSPERRLLSFSGPVTVTRGAFRETADRLTILLEREPAAGRKTSFVPVRVEGDGNVRLENEQLRSTASTIVMSFGKDAASKKRALEAIVLTGSPDVVLRDARAPGGLSGRGESGETRLTCRGELRLSQPTPEEQRIDATDSVTVDLPSSASGKTTLTAGSLTALLRRTEPPSLGSLVATSAARVQFPEATFFGDSIRWTAGARPEDPSVLDVEGHPRLRIENGASVRSELFLDEPGSEAHSEPVEVSCSGPMKIETRGEAAAERLATFSDGVVVRSLGEKDPFTLSARSLSLTLSSTPDGRTEATAMKALDEVEITSVRLDATGDSLHLEPESEGGGHRLVLTGEPASTALKAASGGRQDIRARTLVARQLSPDLRKIEARGDAHASVFLEKPVGGSRIPTDATWVVDAPQIDGTMRRLSDPKGGFDLRELDAQGGVSLEVDGNHGSGSRFTLDRDATPAGAVLLGDAGSPASLKARNEYDAARFDAAVAPEFRFVATADGQRVERVVCPSGAEITRFAPASDLPGVEAERPSEAPRGPLQKTTITSRSEAVFEPQKQIRCTGGFVSRTVDDKGAFAGLLEGQELVIHLRPGSKSPRGAGEVTGATATGSVQLRYGSDLEAFADRMEFDRAAEWITFVGEERDVRVKHGTVTDTSRWIRYNRRTGEMKSGPFQTSVEQRKKG